MPKGTREKILAAALEMLSENGYAGTNMRELMASIGYAKSSTDSIFVSSSFLSFAIAYIPVAPAESITAKAPAMTFEYVFMSVSPFTYLIAGI